MADPDNQTPRPLDELRDGLQSLDQKIDDAHDDLGQKIKNLQQAMIGESVLGRYTVAEVE